MVRRDTSSGTISADDYITKPSGAGELITMIRMV
jgi:DNA-binding response OmpR family regulator